MKNTHITLVSMSFAFMLANVSGVSQAAPPVSAAPSVKLQPAARPQVKQMVKLTAKNAAAVPGETRNVEATLTAGTGDAPVAGKTVHFKLEGKNGPNGPNVIMSIGNGVTNAQGKATVAWAVPELTQGAFTLKAIFGGDDDTMAASDDANFGIIKGITKFDMGDLVWGSIDAQGGPKMGVVFIHLIRQADGKALAKEFTMTVNGKTWQVNIGSSPSTTVQIALPTDTHTWKVKAQFDGDGANQATMVERTYTHN